ncbi:hypothetical protein GCM10023334_111350 [Nonomuraea thailandensis]
MTWLFSGLRSDEIGRLRLGCIRWQHQDAPIRGDSGRVLARDAVCLLDVPTHKTGTAFTKPVDPILGQAIDAWHVVRPDQPVFVDRRTAEQVNLLFSLQARRISYINNTVTPMLCRKAGVPAADVRGNITSHRARSTIASYNAKITPTTLTRACTDAGYFERNVRTVEVLIDRDAVESGAVAAGEPWQYYDLGHGFCNHTCSEECPHRMACAKCDFSTPKDSSKALLLEAKDNLQRMLAAVPPTDDERAAVDDGQAALDRLLGHLADVSTPAGPTPRQINASAQTTLLPIIEINRRPTSSGCVPRPSECRTHSGWPHRPRRNRRRRCGTGGSITAHGSSLTSHGFGLATLSSRHGRDWMTDRRCKGILFVLHTGIAWEHLPRERGYGSGITCWRRLAECNKPACRSGRMRCCSVGCARPKRWTSRAAALKGPKGRAIKRRGSYRRSHGRGAAGRAAPVGTGV